MFRKPYIQRVINMNGESLLGGDEQCSLIRLGVMKLSGKLLCRLNGGNGNLGVRTYLINSNKFSCGWMGVPVSVCDLF